MGMVVQHNLTAMNSNRMLGVTSSAQAKSTEKLSSGYKINRAADDAAGLSISEKMRKQIRGLTQASSNAQDGISAVQTAEGALTEVQDMLQRMNELAVKAANGTNSESDRQAIQDEISQLTTEIDRVAETTKFNETYLLKGDKTATADTKFSYQKVDTLSQDLYYVKDGKVGTAKAGQFVDSLDTSLNYFTSSDGNKVGTAITTDKITTYFDTTKTVTATNLYTKDANGNYLAVAVGDEYTTAPNSYYTVSFETDGTVGSAEAFTGTVATAAAYKVKNNQTVYDQKGDIVKAGTVVAKTAVDNAEYNSAITVGKFDPANAVDLADYTTNAVTQFTDKDGNEIAANALENYLDSDGKLKPDANLYVSEGKLATQADVDKMVNSDDEYSTGALSINLHVGADATDNNQISFKIDAMSAERLGVDGLKVDGADDTNARNAIETIKEALAKVSAQRSTLGAVQNRLEHTINNLDNVVENTTSAESQIRDTDMATEMVKYSNNNILAQAGTSMLAQANQSNQNILSLLG